MFSGGETRARTGPETEGGSVCLYVVYVFIMSCISDFLPLHIGINLSIHTHTTYYQTTTVLSSC